MQSGFIGAIRPPPGVTPNIENPGGSLRTVNLVTQIVSMAIMVPFIALRMYAKIWVTPPFLLEDWACLTAFVLAVGYGMTAVMMSHFGGGYHAWDLAPSDYEGFLKAVYANSLVYGPTAWFTKFALLLVTARVFGNTFRATRIAAWFIIFLMLLYYIPVFIIKAQVYRPIEAYWDQSKKGQSIVSQRSLFTGDTVMSTVSDAAVLVLPIPATLSLRMPMCRKLKIWCMLGLGGVATMASIVRMVFVIKLLSSNDQSFEFVRFNLLGTAEITMGVICACLPACNILISRHRVASRESTEYSASSKIVDVMKSIKFLRGSKLETAPPITPLPLTHGTLNNSNEDIEAR